MTTNKIKGDQKDGVRCKTDKSGVTKLYTLDVWQVWVRQYYTIITKLKATINRLVGSELSRIRLRQPSGNL